MELNKYKELVSKINNKLRMREYREKVKLIEIYKELNITFINA